MQIIPYVDIHNHTDKPVNDHIVSVRSIFVQNFQYALNQADTYFTIGLHPWHVDDVELDDALSKIEQIAQLPNCIGIGEIGLDRAATVLFSKQLVAFEQQLLVAKKVNMPVIIHNVRSLAEILQSIKKVDFNCPVIFHGFTGKIEMARQIINEGAYYLSFGKSLTHSYTSKVVDLIPVNRLFLETDESNYTIDEVYGMASVLLHIPVNDLKRIVYNNFKSVFSKYNAKLA